MFLTAQWLLWHTASSGFARIFDYDLYLRTRVWQSSLLALYICATTKGRSQLLTRALFFVPCHCSYIFVSCPAFHVHVAGDMNKTISFVAGVLSTSFPRPLFGFIRQSPSCRDMQLSFFENKQPNSYRTECFFEAMDMYRTLDLKLNPMDSFHFENNFKRTIVMDTSDHNMADSEKSEIIQ